MGLLDEFFDPEGVKRKQMYDSPAPDIHSFPCKNFLECGNWAHCGVRGTDNENIFLCRQCFLKSVREVFDSEEFQAEMKYAETADNTITEELDQNGE